MNHSLTLLAVLLLPSWASLHAAEPALVAHWTFDEGHGDVARDVTGHGHDATLKDVAWVPSPRGYALRFDRKGSLARYGHVDSMNLSGDMTLAVWVKMDSTVEPNLTHVIFGDTGAGVDRNLNLRLDGRGGLRFEWADGKEVASLIAPDRHMNGSWKYVAVVADSQEERVTMYVDGEAVARTAGAMPMRKAPVKDRITGWFYNGYFQGALDDIRLYARALSPQEIRQLFVKQADLQVGEATVLFDASQSKPRGIAVATVRNWSKEPRRLEVSGSGVEKRELSLKPGDEAEVSLGEVAIRPVWRGRNDLFVSQQSQPGGRVSVAVHRGDLVEHTTLGLSSEVVLEPLRVHVNDPWQRALAPGKTERLEFEVQFALPAEQLRQGKLQIGLVSRETGREALSRQILSPQAQQSLALDVRALPWGAYDLRVSYHDQAGREVVSTKRLTTILPDGKQQIRVLNNLVSELMDAHVRGLIDQPRIEFMNPRNGWVWFRAAGNCSLQLGDDRLLTAEKEKPATEAMRLLPAGKHVLQVNGAPTDLTIRAIPALVYNVYPSTPRIAPFGANTWERLRKHMLPNVNMIESSLVDTPEHAEWLAQGKCWLANVQAPGLIDEKEWTAEKMLDVWLKPGTSTAHAERPGLVISKLSGLQVDEYYPGAKSARFMEPLVSSLAQLAEHPAFAGKLWIPFVSGKFGATPTNLLMKTLLGAGWPFSEEVYVGEMPTEAENSNSIRSSFLGVAGAYQSAHPGSVRRMIFTPMYAYLPYCTTNRYPQADFRVHLDMQMQLLAADPAFFGLWGVQPYRSNYVDEEILNCMGRMLRHYCIEGRVERMLSDPYELRHLKNPDFEAGTNHWQVAAAKEGAITAGTFAGYGTLQGRYPSGAFGDAFVRLKRSNKGPNLVSQQLQGLKPGRLYSLKLITADLADLQGGRSKKNKQAISIAIDGAEVLPGGFSYPFPSCRGPIPFTTQSPFWMTYHWLQFRARSSTAKLSISDWAKLDTPGGPIGQEIICNFVEVQPVLPD